MFCLVRPVHNDVIHLTFDAGQALENSLRAFFENTLAQMKCQMVSAYNSINPRAKQMWIKVGAIFQLSLAETSVGV